MAAATTAEVPHVERTRQHVRMVAAILADIDQGFTVTHQHGGLRLTAPVLDSHFPPLYLMVYPWSRGWAIYITDNPDDAIYDWRHVKFPYRNLQRPLYTARNVTGPWHVPVETVCTAAISVYDRAAEI